jgi:hypothetical protein
VGAVVVVGIVVADAAVVVVVGIVVFGFVWLLRFSLSRHLQRQGYRPSRLPPALDPDHEFDMTHSVSFRGGSRVGRGNATMPLVQLRFDDDWAHLSGAGQFFGGPAPVWIDRSAVLGVRRISAPLGRGIRFDTSDGRYDGVIFWTSSPGEVLDALHDHNWPSSDSNVNEADGE